VQKGGLTEKTRRFETCRDSRAGLMHSTKVRTARKENGKKGGKKKIKREKKYIEGDRGAGTNGLSRKRDSERSHNKKTEDRS